MVLTKMKLQKVVGGEILVAVGAAVTVLLRIMHFVVFESEERYRR
jgi:hypothetical protein